MRVEMGVKRELLTLSRDGRGSVCEPLAGAELASQRNVHVVLTEPGQVRGNHYHLRGTETVTVYGPALARVREGGEVSDTHIPEGQAVRFTFPPGVAHAFKNTGERTNVLIAFNTVEHDPRAPDVVRDELIESSGARLLR